jgi:hypothetical protein
MLKIKSFDVQNHSSTFIYAQMFYELGNDTLKVFIKVRTSVQVNTIPSRVSNVDFKYVKTSNPGYITFGLSDIVEHLQDTVASMSNRQDKMSNGAHHKYLILTSST